MYSAHQFGQCEYQRKVSPQRFASKIMWQWHPLQHAQWQALKDERGKQMQAVSQVTCALVLQAHGHTVRLGLGIKHQPYLCRRIKRRIEATKNLQ
ncbi:hypothetical protein WL34_01700 [Burkholderia cepacia]|nr:hypothetical protein WL34_01700 [Burkholderia cepacia]